MHETARLVVIDVAKGGYLAFLRQPDQVIRAIRDAAFLAVPIADE